MLLLPIIIPVIMGIKLLFKDIKNIKLYSISVTIVTLILSIIMIKYNGYKETILELPYNMSIILKIDDISLIFSILFCFIWLIVLLYSLDYMKHDNNSNRFFSFYLATLGPLIGLSYSNNFVTFYMFFEFVSILSFALVLHDQTDKAINASKKYLFYSIGGALIGLLAIFYFYNIPMTNYEFIEGGHKELLNNNINNILMFSLLFAIGFGCKAGLFPLQGWLKTAHPIAPAPASAVLSGITTKAGVIAFIRLFYYFVPIELFKGTVYHLILVTITLLTIFLGSMLAYKEKVIKTRLAYSTVSQVSYVLLGLLMFNEYAFVGAMLHVVFHALAKNSLFLAAGVFIHNLHITNVSDLKGLGNKTKASFISFGIAGLSLVGIPFTAGFISKYYLAMGALENGTIGLISVSIIMISALLTAGYLLTIFKDAFFCEKECMDNEEVLVTRNMKASILPIMTILLGVFPTSLINIFMDIVHKLM